MLDCQMEYLRCWAKEQGWVIAGETREIRSGVFPDRPGLREVTQAAAEGRMDTVVVKKLTLDNDTFENTGKSRFFERRTSRVLY